jgi:ATP-dependent Lon protease
MAPEPSDLHPTLILDEHVVFPGSVARLTIKRTASLAALEAHPEPDAMVILAWSEGGRPAQSLLGCVPIGVEARVLERLTTELGVELVVQGRRRVRLVPPHESSPFIQSSIEAVDERAGDPFHVTVLMQKAAKLYERLLSAGEGHPKALLTVLREGDGAPGAAIDQVAAGLNVSHRDTLTVLRKVTWEHRLRALIEAILAALEQVKVARDVEKKARKEIDQSRRDYYLRQQMKVIRKELGEEDLSRREADRYGALLDALELDEAVAREARREIERLGHIQPSSSEYQVIKTFLDRFFELPWGVETQESIDLPHVRSELDDGHYGLDKVKERILEFLAVRKLNPSHKGPILCFAGPPGVGKTSLGEAIAEAIGRKFFRISVGGVRDEAEIRGHRRTYIGALPGKILNGLTRAGCMNPLLMLDEIDKIGSDHRGDPASALLEVLDPAQNNSFTDHYFNVPFDLSKVLFVVTANYLHDIPRPLLDRLEVISIEGYTESEKLQIARRHLIPQVIAEHGLASAPPAIDDEAVRGVIRTWTREAGVRNLQRALEKISRKVALKRVESGNDAEALTIEFRELPDYLGPERYRHDEGVGSDQVGAANGLAWTASGGEVLVIEALKMPGKGKLVITGKLGEVMKESVQAAYSFTRSRAEHLGLKPDALDGLDLHIHFPAGAVPKDGPSAGVTVTLALASLLSERAVRSDFAMTGEVTLRGKVLPVGGVKDKLLAAYRAGIRNVVIPKANEKDLVEVPDEVKAVTTFHCVDHVDRLLELALVPAEAG